MDVGTVGVAQSALNAYQAGSARKAADTLIAQKNAGLTEDTNPHGEAFSVDISSAAKQAQAQAAGEAEGDIAKTAENTVTTATDNAGETDATETEGAKTKGLSNDEIQALMADVQEKSMQFMMDLMGANNNKLQDYLDNGVGILNFNGVQVDASRFAMPEVATTPEEAEKALAEGGDWSVGKVADRIFGLAETLAAGDPEKLEQMRSAVKQGFEQAGTAFKEHFGAKDTPQITKDTYNEIMSRFDKKAEEMKNATQTANDNKNQIQVQSNGLE